MIDGCVRVPKIEFLGIYLDLKRIGMRSGCSSKLSNSGRIKRENSETLESHLEEF
jgi:hypothetical protein